MYDVYYVAYLHASSSIDATVDISERHNTAAFLRKERQEVAHTKTRDNRSSIQKYNRFHAPTIINSMLSVALLQEMIPCGVHSFTDIPCGANSYIDMTPCGVNFIQ